MIKTIKQVKEMRLDEVIKYIWDNEIGNIVVKNKTGDKKVYHGVAVLLYGDITKEDVFEVFIEDTITEDTKFESVVINTEKSLYSFRNISIRECRIKLPKVTEIFARIDGRLHKVWECEE